MILSDTSLEKRLSGGLIDGPFDDRQINPASLDVTLCGAARYLKTDYTGVIDTARVEEIEYAGFDFNTVVIYPGNFWLMSTKERFFVPTDLVGILSGKSSLGRLGLQIHATAGFIDPGFFGNITLEVTNTGPLGIKLYEGMRIGQVSFTTLDEPANKPYGDRNRVSHYQGQEGPTESKYEL